MTETEANIALVESFFATIEHGVRFAQFLEVHDGKITAQRNYDCFYPW